MTTLLEASKALVARWDTPLWKDVPSTAEYINELRTAISEAEKVGPVATLHDDGYWTWKGTPPYASSFAGWRMDVYAAPQPALKLEPIFKCWCNKCNEGVFLNGIPFAATRMILCPDCGDKRCPKASDHTKQCAGAAPVPAQERKPLTIEEISKAWAQSKGDVITRLLPFARAIEAAHGIKEQP